MAQKLDFNLLYTCFLLSTARGSIEVLFGTVLLVEKLERLDADTENYLFCFGQTHCFYSDVDCYLNENVVFVLVSKKNGIYAGDKSGVPYLLSYEME